MGATLALEAVAYCNLRRIQPVPRCVLMWMALRAIDDANATPEKPARLSFMSRAQLGLAIGRFMPDREPGSDATAEERRQWDADDQAIARALRTLKTAGAISEIGRARPGQTSRFVINLGRPLQITERHPMGNAQRSPLGTLSDSRGNAHRSPKEEREVTTGEATGTTLPRRASHLPSVDNSNERKSA